MSELQTFPAFTFQSQLADSATRVLADGSIHGLNVVSDFPGPELLPAWGPPDIRILRGTVPAAACRTPLRGCAFNATPGHFFLRVAGVASYWAKGGRGIIVDPSPAADLADVGMFLYGTVLSALLQQRGCVVIHAGSVAGRSGAVLIGGDSGCGKSTTLAALHRRGRRVLTDDQTALTRHSSGRPLSHAGSPQLKLWADAAERFCFAPAEIRRVRRGLDKFQFPTTGQASVVPCDVARIFVLDMQNNADVVTERVEHAAAFEVVRTLTRNANALPGLGVLKKHFELCAAVASSVPVVRIHRPIGRDTVDKIADLIEECL